MSSKQLLLDLINNTNFPPVPLTDQNVDLLNLQSADGGASWNTSVDVTAKANQGYEGERTLYYRRLQLTVLGTLSFASSSVTDAQSLLDLINQATGAGLELVDLQPVTIPPAVAGQDAACVLTSDPGSYRWIGELTVTITGPIAPPPPPPAPTVSVGNAVLETTP